MFYLKKILKDNNIKIIDISKELNIKLSLRFCLHSDFSLMELQKIKKYLVSRNIISKNFDIGCFLDEV